MEAQHLALAQFRYPYEIPVLIGTMAVSVVLLFVFGALGLGFLLSFLGYLALSVFMAWVQTYSYRGTAIEVGERQLPHIHQMAVELAGNLSIPKPRVFIVQSPQVNAFTTGFTKPFNVVIFSGLLDLMDERELRGVLAHEFGHAKANHMLFGLITGLTSGNLISQWFLLPLKWLFFWYQRCMEYTADRAGLVATMDVQAMVTTFIKLSSGAKAFAMMNIPAFIEQMENFQGNMMSRMSEMLTEANHPFALNRIQHIIRFYKGSEYQSLAAQHGRAGTSTLTAGPQGTRDLYLRVAERVQVEKENAKLAAAIQGQQGPALQQAPAPLAHCSSCNAPLVPGTKFCANCGRPVAAANPQAGMQPAPANVAPQPQSPDRPPAGPESRARVVVRVNNPGTASTVCANCQAPLNANAKFCQKCGTPVKPQGV